MASGRIVPTPTRVAAPQRMGLAMPADMEREIRPLAIGLNELRPAVGASDALECTAWPRVHPEANAALSLFGLTGSWRSCASVFTWYRPCVNLRAPFFSIFLVFLYFFSVFLVFLYFCVCPRAFWYYIMHLRAF